MRGNLRWPLTIRGRFILIFLLASIPLAATSVLSTLWTAKNSGELIRNQLQNYTSTLHAVIETLLQANVQTYLRSKVEMGIEIIRNALQRSSGREVPKEVVDELLSYRVGLNGYFYALDLEGKVVFHPDRTIVGTNQTGKEPVDQQLEQRWGYMEYSWQNTYEEDPRRKALYMEFLPSMGWILTATSYRDEFTHMIDPEGLRKAVTSVQFGKSGYSYLVSREGLVISHPYLQGALVKDYFKPEEVELFMSRFFSLDQGYTTYPWKEPDGDTRTKLVYHKQLHDFGWVVATSIYIDEMHQPYNFLVGINVVISLAAMVSLGIAIYAITRSMEQPLQHMIEVLREASSGNLSIQMKTPGLRELNEVAEHLNYFIQELREKISSLGNLTAGISHELNSPLAAILSTTRFLELNLHRNLLDQGKILANTNPQELLAYYSLLERAISQPKRLDSLLSRDTQRCNSILALDPEENVSEDVVEALRGLGIEGEPEVVEQWISTARSKDLLLAAYRMVENFYAIHLIEQASQKAARVVETLRNYIYTGEEEPEEILRLSEEVELILSQFQHRMGEKLMVSRDFDPKAIFRGKRKRLSLVWNALIKNALDSMETEGTLTVRTCSTEQNVRVEISDTGPGINPSIRDRIFEPFFTTKRGGAGIGLGLTISRKIVEEHGGTLVFETSPEKTTFMVSFPNLENRTVP